jgi:hypothetical protein
MGSPPSANCKVLRSNEMVRNKQCERRIIEFRDPPSRLEYIEKDPLLCLRLVLVVAAATPCWCTTVPYWSDGRRGCRR